VTALVITNGLSTIALYARCKTIVVLLSTEMFLSVSQMSREETEVKNSLEIVKREKQEDHFKYKESLMKKDEELKKLNALCKSLEKLMNEKSAAEKEVREKVTDKDVQLKVEIFISNFEIQSYIFVFK
jgi:mannitol-specific phosphotransferase system IIBC component